MKAIPFPVRIGLGLLLGVLVLTQLGDVPELTFLSGMAGGLAVAAVIGGTVYLLVGWSHARMMKYGGRGEDRTVPSGERAFYIFAGRRILAGAVLIAVVEGAADCLWRICYAASAH